MTKHLDAPDLGLDDKHTLAMLEIGLFLSIAALGAFMAVCISTSAPPPQ